MENDDVEHEKKQNKYGKNERSLHIYESGRRIMPIGKQQIDEYMSRVNDDISKTSNYYIEFFGPLPFYFKVGTPLDKDFPDYFKHSLKEIVRYLKSMGIRAIPQRECPKNTREFFYKPLPEKQEESHQANQVLFSEIQELVNSINEGKEVKETLAEKIEIPEKAMIEKIEDLEKNLRKRYYCPWLALTLGNFLSGVKGKKILDIGCNSSLKDDYGPHLCKTLSERGAITVGIDRDVEETHKQFGCYNIHPKKGLITFTEGEFDAVVTSQFFSSLPFTGFKEWYYNKNIKPIMKEICRILKHGGIYFNTESNPKLNVNIFRACREQGLDLQLAGSDRVQRTFDRYLVLRKGRK